MQNTFVNAAAPFSFLTTEKIRNKRKSFIRKIPHFISHRIMATKLLKLVRNSTCKQNRDALDIHLCVML